MADNADAIRQKIEELKSLLVDDGMDENTADALLFAVAPAETHVRGNLADLQRMGAIAVTGENPTGPALQGESTSDTSAAFVEPTEGKTDFLENVPQGAENEEGLIEGNSRVSSEGPTNVEDAGEGEQTQTVVNDSMTKQELLDEATRRGVTADDSMTKAEIISAINA